MHKDLHPKETWQHLYLATVAKEGHNRSCQATTSCVSPSPALCVETLQIQINFGKMHEEVPYQNPQFQANTYVNSQVAASVVSNSIKQFSCC